MKQSTALKLMQQGRNVFLTGQAGSGKTHVLNQYITWLRTHGIEPAITASTGIAATHIGGTTIHSWSGMGINSELTSQVLSDVLDREPVWKRVKKNNILILDEISMVSPGLLDAVNQIAQAVRENTKPFGGMQVICCGDFFQLPPIVGRQQAHADASQVAVKSKRYAWQAPAWVEAEMTVCYLEEQYRQDESDGLTRVLNDIRDGEATEDSLEVLRERFDAPITEEKPPIRLYTHNADVDAINQTELETIEEAPHYFEMSTTGSLKYVESLKKSALAVEQLELRVGARVIFVRNNYEKGYVNGSMGIVTGFDDKTEYPLVELYSGEVILASPDDWALEQDGKKVATLAQIPLRLAWAITIHKSQGMSLDAAEIDLSKCFEVGQGYVALSRVRSLEGLYLRGFNTMATTMDPLTLRVDERFKELSGEVNTAHKDMSDEQIEEYIVNFIEQSGGSVDSIDYVSEREKKMASTYDQTRALLEQGMSLEEIATTRELAQGTIMGHILSMQRRGESISVEHLERDESLVETVQEVYDELVGQDGEDLYDADGQVKLKPIFKMLDGEVSYDDIKLALLFIEK